MNNDISVFLWVSSSRIIKKLKILCSEAGIIPKESLDVDEVPTWVIKTPPFSEKTLLYQRLISNPRVYWIGLSNVKKSGFQKSFSHFSSYLTYPIPIQESPKAWLALKQNPNIIAYHFYHIKTFEDAQCLSEFLYKKYHLSRLSQIALMELLLNAIEHGNLCISFHEKENLQRQHRWLNFLKERMNSPKFDIKYVSIQILVYLRRIEIRIRDQGNGFDWKKHYQKVIDCQLPYFRRNGRGLLIASSSDLLRLQYLGNGNTVRCIFPRTK